MLKLTKGWESDSGRNDCSEPWNESDIGPVTFILRLQFTEYWSQEWAGQVGKYHLELHAVCPKAAGKSECASAAGSVGLDLDAFHKLEQYAQCEILMDYGISACLWQQSGNNRRRLEREGRKQLALISGMMFGFYMDRRLNAIGSTGWDFIKGDIMAGARRPRE